MTTHLPYFRSAAATISYVPAAYVHLDWQATTASAADLQAVYENVLRAMQRHGLTRLMSVHNQRPPMPAPVQHWLTHDWIPRAVAETRYQRCAIVEAATPLGRLASRAVGSAITIPLVFQYFRTEAEAETWLLA